ncbi:ImmA/IrrE family metallo-endopeptidase [Amycolatopsis pithecellobii]|uniref:ImmA/IrrE family metallo-endopeptidase n=1 Tax=Amycolatopsis pithecellobii TaxID=664692 RepID=A0A6N7ZAQ4_9PSEU|nr:ImmA/IrrE family metallo-endopeptidase [Amycolatopsis pithecellobii]MTD58841.1 ImmA/IrrE family metallo-endopeptidase [Amycolatopsis pithecellobii]
MHDHPGAPSWPRTLKLKLRRGFKKEAKELALEVRQELGTAVFAPLDPYALAKLYGIKVVDLTQPGLPAESVRYLTELRPHVFSGALIPLDPSGTVILENHVHHPKRRRATVAHEMAHVLLEHPFEMTLADEHGCRSAVSEIEAEATELSGELMIPADAARIAAFKGWSDQSVANHFRVSVPLARWRMNVTGARRIACRWRANAGHAVAR